MISGVAVITTCKKDRVLMYWATLGAWLRFFMVRLLAKKQKFSIRWSDRGERPFFWLFQIVDKMQWPKAPAHPKVNNGPIRPGASIPLKEVLVDAINEPQEFLPAHIIAGRGDKMCGGFFPGPFHHFFQVGLDLFPYGGRF